MSLAGQYTTHGYPGHNDQQPPVMDLSGRVLRGGIVAYGLVAAIWLFVR
jgi:hypothetical protein